jgi:lipid II:glycine glycyltransferase (peptidoglycan interpeptide bridge formation enzyme)
MIAPEVDNQRMAERGVPQYALQWHAILDARRSGCRAYNMGEVSQGNTSLAAYKEKWGAKRYWLYR